MPDLRIATEEKWSFLLQKGSGSGSKGGGPVESSVKVGWEVVEMDL